MRVNALPDRGDVVEVNDLSVREIVGGARGPRGCFGIVYYNEYNFSDDEGRRLCFHSGPTRMQIGSKNRTYSKFKNNPSLINLKNGDKIQVSGRGKPLPKTGLTLNGKKL